MSSTLFVDPTRSSMYFNIPDEPASPHTLDEEMEMQKNQEFLNDFLR